MIVVVGCAGVTRPNVRVPEGKSRVSDVKVPEGKSRVNGAEPEPATGDVAAQTT